MMDKERTKAIEILGVFEDFLEEKGIDIPNKERDEYDSENPDNDGTAILFGSEYYLFEDKITKILKDLYNKKEEKNIKVDEKTWWKLNSLKLNKQMPKLSGVISYLIMKEKGDRK